VASRIAIAVWRITFLARIVLSEPRINHSSETG
jgi:hypothetical protein